MTDPFQHPGHTLVAALEAVALDNLHERACRARPGAVIRRLRGAKCADERGFFDEAMAALQFPQYSAANWNAFDEGLAQYWLPADGILIIVADAQRAFVDRPAALATLGTIVANLASRPLRLLLQAPPAEHAALVARLAGAAVPHWSL
jgi:hypothetical protein